MLLYHHLGITHEIIWASYNMRFLKDFFQLVFVVGESFSQIIVRETYIVIFTVNNYNFFLSQEGYREVFFQFHSSS